MSDITFTGIGSGLQVSEIVSAIVGAERAPFESRLNQQEAQITTDISAVGALKSALEELASAVESLADTDNFQKKQATGIDAFVGLSVDKDAQVGNYSVKVNNLASAHKVMSSEFTSAEAVGEGTLSFSSGFNNFDITVSDTDTLSDVRDAINASDDNSSVIATIVTDDLGEHLILTSKETGLNNSIKVTAADIDGNNTDATGLSRLAYDTDPLSATFATNLTEVNAALDASITIDGTLNVTSTTNKFENVIDGVDITAQKAHGVDDDISQIGFVENNSGVRSNVENFVEKYNELLDLTNALGQVGDSGIGPLAGDAMLRGVTSKLRQSLSTSFESGTNSSLSLAQIGVTSDRYGKLSVDTTILNDALDEDPSAIEQFFVGSDDADGFARSLKTLTDFYTESDGIIENRIESKQTQLERLDDDRIDFDRKMDSLEARLLAQYNAMDLLVANLNSTSSYIQAQLDNMPGVVKQDN
jgi:flagellar hook-associated protein 2